MFPAVHCSLNLVFVLLVLLESKSEASIASKNNDNSFRVSEPKDEGGSEVVDPKQIPLELLDAITLLNYSSDVPGVPLNPEDFDAADALNDFTISYENGDPIMLAGLFQGDIVISSSDQYFDLTAHTGTNSQITDTQNNAILDMNKRWRNGVIPYSISSSFSSSDRAVIARALQEYEQKTCIRFTPRRNEEDYIYMVPGNGCSSGVGRTGGRQDVSLGVGCVYLGIVLHELMHAAGFWHEQSRFDRDDHIQIVWSNIQSSMQYNFQKYDWTIIQNLGVGYDTGSIMHYGPYAFAIDRSRPTIVAKSGADIGQRDGFSPKDLAKLRKLYECDATSVIPPPAPTPQPGGCTDSDQYCSYWASIGECQKNPAWMHNNCKKSCNQCNNGCKDDDSRCKQWQQKGECKKSVAYMSRHCKKSCGLCGGTGTASYSCKDTNEYCSAWSLMGECRVNPDYMLVSCAKSCGQC